MTTMSAISSSASRLNRRSTVKGKHPTFLGYSADSTEVTDPSNSKSAPSDFEVKRREDESAWAKSIKEKLLATGGDDSASETESARQKKRAVRK